MYVSHDAENLQFWLWLEDYTKRFYAAPRSEQILSPPWYQVEAPQPTGAEQQPVPLAKGIEMNNPGVSSLSSYEVMFHTLDPSRPQSPPQFDEQSFISGKTGLTKVSVAESVQDVNAQMGLKWQSCMAFSSRCGGICN